MNLNNTADIAQIVLALATSVGVIAAFLATRQTLREVQRDREARYAPFLSFMPGGWQIDIEFLARGRIIPGINPAYVARILSDIPSDAKSVHLKGIHSSASW